MKFICTQSSFSSHLSLASRAIPSRPSHPVLANVLLRADADTQQITLVGFDLSLGIQTSFSAQVEEAGTITLPSKLLGDIVSRLPEGDITVSNEKDIEVVITSSSGRYEIRGMAVDEYPELPTVTEGAIALPTDALLEGLRGSLFSTSTDETKQVLTGVHITLDDGIEFAATDGHRLSVVKYVPEVEEEAQGKPESEEEKPEPVDFTIPGKALRELEKMIQLTGVEGLAIALDEGQAQFMLGANQKLTTRLLEGQYPAYHQLVPKQFSRQMTAERRLLMGALERIAVLADQKNSILKFGLSNSAQELIVSVDAQDVGSGREAIACQYSGEDLDIAFNAKYLLEGLKAMASAEVQMSFNSPTSPVVITPLGGSKMTYLCMPVQIRS